MPWSATHYQGLLVLFRSLFFNLHYATDMANILLISYAGYPYTPSSLCPDNGLGLLAALLRQAGHHVRILDFGTVQIMGRLYPEELSRRAGPLFQELATHTTPTPALLEELRALDQALEAHQTREVQKIGEEVVREVATIEPAFVGFKLWNGDGFVGSIAIAQAIRKKYPRMKLFAGGPHATWFGPVIYQRTDVFDAIVIGEAETRIVDLVEYAAGSSPRKLDEIQGLVLPTDSRAIRSENGLQVAPTEFVSLDDLPLVTYDEEVYPAMSGDQKLKFIVLEDSRGCPYRCAFCIHSFESGRRLRTRSAKRIVDDMQAIIHNHSIGTFRFAGSSTPGSLMAEVAQEIIRRGLKVRYTSFAHFESSQPEHFSIMSQSGLYAMFFGLESGSEEILRKGARKPIKLQEVRKTVEAAKAAGIRVVCSMIVPMPFETEQSLSESKRLIVELRPHSVPVQFPGLLPGTLWFNTPAQYGFEVDKDTYLREHLDYKIKLLFPPTFWKPLPYKLNGMGFREFSRITAEFAAALEAEGILTNVPDDNLLMAELSGMTPRQFRDQARWWCATGDVKGMEEFVVRYNRACSQLTVAA